MIGESGPKAFQPQVDILLGPLEGDVSKEHSLDDKPCPKVWRDSFSYVLLVIRCWETHSVSLLFVVIYVSFGEVDTPLL